MTDENSEKDAGQAGAPPWLRATLDDVQHVDFEAPVAGSTAADCHELFEQFEAASQATGKEAERPDTPTTRVYTMLSAITGIHFTPEAGNAPFGPMFVLADGRRSAIPEDFRGDHLEVLAYMAERAQHPALRARLSDMCWLLDRKRGRLGTLAISAYVETVQRADAGDLKFRFEEETGALKHGARDYLRRALQVGRAVGWDKAETIAARDLVIQLRTRAVARRSPIPAHWFSQLDLDFGLSDPVEIGAGLEEVIATPPATELRSQAAVDLWRLAARAYHHAKKDNERDRCLSEAAERLVLEAEDCLANQHSAMLASHILSAAIAELHGVSGKKDRRTELRHRLIDIQAGIYDEMSTFSQEMDLQEIADRVEKGIGKLELLDMLFFFAALARSPDPEILVREAIKRIQEHPLSSLFGTAHFDHEGKVIHRADGGGIADSDADDPAVRQQIAQAETIRRQYVAMGKIEVARRSMVTQYYISDDVLQSLLQYSPFVPSDLLATFSRGFVRFFQGDFVSATYILTPLLENSLRYILKSNGHDVTTFDDATKTQEDRTISSLFEQMRSELDQVLTRAISADIENLFLAKPGPYLRHSLAHGLLHDGDPFGADAMYGCWLIFQLCLLPLFPHRERLKASLG